MAALKVMASWVEVMVMAAIQAEAGLGSTGEQGLKHQQPWWLQLLLGLLQLLQA